MSKRLFLLSLLFLLVISLPFLYAARAAGPQAVFGGFLLNPQDGNTYLAKMYQGRQGAWRYHLAFSAQPGEDVFLFVFYLFLGHLARWSGLPLVWVFHLARLAGAVCLLAAIWRFLGATAPPAWRGWAYATALFGLGLGWLAFPFGRVTSDFWIAEAYPFLSAYTTPHFAFSLALLVALLTLPQQPARSTAGFAGAALAGLALSLLSPFGLVMALLALAGTIILGRLPAPPTAGADGGGRAGLGAWFAAPQSRRAGLHLGGALLGGVPFSVYNVWIARVHPQLAAWNAQNLTWTPAAWDVLLALSPALLLALPGAVGVVRGRIRSAYPLLAWAAGALAMIYLPVDLQRRFMIGVYLPLVGLAAYALTGLAEARPALSRRAAAWSLALALPTTLLLLLVGLSGATGRDPLLYLSADEAQALAWLEANSAPDALALASPQMGLLIPAHTGRRVIYGHPYETVNAAAEQAAVVDFYAGRLPAPQDFLAGRGVDFVFDGPRERRIGALPADLPLEPVFSAGEVTVYRVVPRRAPE